MKKLIRHPLSWIILVLLLFPAFFLWPDSTDTGEEPETEEIEHADHRLEEQKAIQEAATDTVLPIAPEPRDETKEVIDTTEVVVNHPSSPLIVSKPASSIIL